MQQIIWFILQTFGTSNLLLIDFPSLTLKYSNELNLIICFSKFSIDGDPQVICSVVNDSIHSSNATMKRMGDSAEERIALYSLADGIQENEDISYNYGLSNENMPWRSEELNVIFELYRNDENYPIVVDSSQYCCYCKKCKTQNWKQFSYSLMTPVITKWQKVIYRRFSCTQRFA